MNKIFILQSAGFLILRSFCFDMQKSLHRKSFLNLPGTYRMKSCQKYTSDSVRTIDTSLFCENPTKPAALTNFEASQGIFCNRELTMKSLKAIGFDMDFTLAQYHPEFDLLAYEGAKEKLVYQKNYPKEVLDFEYEEDFFQRGLVIDKEKGNILKLDRHKYVRVAYHGFAALQSKERKRVYQFPCSYTDNERYVNVDTLFTIVDAVLFSQLVELKDEDPDDSDMLNRSYKQIYTDVRHAVDLCHRDGYIKQTVSEHPEKFIVSDPGMVAMLKSLKHEGFQIFLATNSEWEYTDVVMNYLCGNVRPEERTKEWIDLFDVVFCLAAKPAFLTDDRRNLLRVNIETGSLSNIDTIDANVEQFLDKGKVFQAGSWKHLQTLLNVSRGDQILYVGDHMYSDVLRTKRTLGWRTCIVVPEMEKELWTHSKSAHLCQDLKDLRNLQFSTEESADKLFVEMRAEQDMEKRKQLEHHIEQLENEKNVIKKILRQVASLFHHQFHPVWGQIFKAGYQDSRFAHQITEYACLYTSKASNLGAVSSKRCFRTSSDVLPHDHVVKQIKNEESEHARMLAWKNRVQKHGAES